MRLDKYLKVSRLIKRRTVANSACDNERVLVNGATAHKLFMKNNARFLDGRAWVRLPSTSPAYTLSYERKFAQWREALTL